MTILSVILIGLSLSMDTFAVSVGAGISMKGLKIFYIVRASLFFGFFQFIMPVAGWHLGKSFAVYIQTFAHWVAFGLLFFVGAKMIWETLRSSDSAAGSTNIRSLPNLLTLSVAAVLVKQKVGVSFSVLDHNIWLPAAIIGLITFSVCIIGFEFGRRIGGVLGKWAGIAGGLVLIGIGIKILIEHL